MYHCSTDRQRIETSDGEGPGAWALAERTGGRKTSACVNSGVVCGESCRPASLTWRTGLIITELNCSWAYSLADQLARHMHARDDENE